jgi:hypothetical protein
VDRHRCQLPAVAPQIALDTGKSGVPTKGPWAMEDWYRALALMKHAYRAQSSSRATAGVKVQDVQAELPSFLQAVDVGGPPTRRRWGLSGRRRVCPAAVGPSSA